MAYTLSELEARLVTAAIEFRKARPLEDGGTSEWMGYFLRLEAAIDAVIKARETLRPYQRELKAGKQIPATIICNVPLMTMKCGGRANLLFLQPPVINSAGLEEYTYLCEKCRTQIHACWGT